MLANAERFDITPKGPVWMDGMVRSHPSIGVNDPVYLKVLALADSKDPKDCNLLVSLDVCAVATADALEIRQTIARQTGVPVGQIVIAATHNHSGPALLGQLNPKADAYLNELKGVIAEAVSKTLQGLQPSLAGWMAGAEGTISHYRRLMADDGHVVMNWESYPQENIIGPLGKMDPEVLVLRVTDNSHAPLGLFFNHAGHPNVLSGDNYLISSDYPGLAEKIIQDQMGGVALFFNGAQGSVDIDGLKDRDHEGLERVASVLANAVIPLAAQAQLNSLAVLSASQTFNVPARKITPAEMRWASDILKNSEGGKLQSMPDGVGDDYKARLYQKLHAVQDTHAAIEQTCIAIGDSALITFPGELFTEIGIRIKALSPFRHTAIVGLANGYCGYVPTAKAVLEGGYEPDTRRLDAGAEEIIVENSLNLLGKVHALYKKK